MLIKTTNPPSSGPRPILKRELPPPPSGPVLQHVLDKIAKRMRKGKPLKQAFAGLRGSVHISMCEDKFVPFPEEVEKVEKEEKKKRRRRRRRRSRRRMNRGPKLHQQAQHPPWILGRPPQMGTPCAWAALSPRRWSAQRSRHNITGGDNYLASCASRIGTTSASM